MTGCMRGIMNHHIGGGGVWGRCINFSCYCIYLCLCVCAQETNRRKKAREKLLKKKQLEDPLATLTPQEEEQFQTRDTTKYPRIPGECAHARTQTLHTHTHTHTHTHIQVTSDHLRGRNKCCGNSVTGNTVSHWHVAEKF